MYNCIFLSLMTFPTDKNLSKSVIHKEKNYRKILFYLFFPLIFTVGSQAQETSFFGILHFFFSIQAQSSIYFYHVEKLRCNI